MAYWADILHPAEPEPSAKEGKSRPDAVNVAAALRRAGVDPDDDDAQRLASDLLRHAGVVDDRGGGPGKKLLPLPAFLRRPITRRFLEALVADTAAYFFRRGIRKRIQDRLRAVLPTSGEPVTVVSHSQGTIVAYEVLATLDRPEVAQLVTLGSPLGIQEIQDHLEPGEPLRIPSIVKRWNNFADPLDPVALDKGLAREFAGNGLSITDEIIVNGKTRTLVGFNPHSAVGYLAHPSVRKVVHRAVRFDSMSRFVVARDVAETMAVQERHSVLIEVLEPGYPAVGDDRDATIEYERKVEGGDVSLASRVRRAAAQLGAIVVDRKEARIDELRRFVSARLTPAELRKVAHDHRDLRVYAVWRSASKSKLLDRSGRVLKSDAALASYDATGDGVTWAVLDTGVRQTHPHFATHQNVVAVWDCTKRGKPTQLTAKDGDADGHGTHVCGIIAGAAPEGTKPQIQGIAPRARLVVYKVLDDAGNGEDAWIIKALDHIAEQNENNAALAIHGVNLSLGGPFDSTVYGCGFSPICTELRRLWRSGVLVVVASGNEGQTSVDTPDGELELNTSMSIADPANLEDCIAVGAVNADRPNLYGVSSFSSRGPTADGRIKPDVVAPGERILSCNSRFRSASRDLYYRESGTSMAAPHVSGLLAAFLSVRKEFKGRPDEVKRILLDACTDIGRDRYHQGRGIPNLMKMLTDV